MKTTADYVALITNEHAQRAKFIATLQATIDPLTRGQAVLRGLNTDFDIDTAVGVQLDILGIWIGISRRVAVPLVGVYFTFDDTIQTGWDSGSWQGPFDPDSGLTELPDEDYRILLKAKIAANSWDGSIPGAYSVWESAFNDESFILIQDNQDMSMIIAIVGQPLSAVSQALLTQGYIPLKPAGVRIAYYAVPVDENPLFAWDVTNTLLNGWGAGSWAKELLPT